MLCFADSTKLAPTRMVIAGDSQLGLYEHYRFSGLWALGPDVKEVFGVDLFGLYEHYSVSGAWVVEPDVDTRVSLTCRTPVVDILEPEWFFTPQVLVCPCCVYVDSSVFCTLCDCCLKLIEKKLTKVSAINGNNGSWTNTDDHDNDNSTRKRVNKECKSHMRSTGGCKTKVQSGPTVDSLAASQRFHNKPSIEEVAIVEDIWYIYSHDHPYLFDEHGKLYSRINRSLVFKAQDGSLIDNHLIQEGHIKQGHAKSGCIYASVSGTKVCASHDLVASRFRPGCHDGVYDDGFVGYYYKPLFREYQQALPLNGKPTLQRKCIALGTAQKKFVNLDDKIIQWTVSYFDAHQRYMARKLVTDHETSSIYKTTETINGLYDKDTLKAARGINYTTRFESAYVLPAVQCLLQSDWEKKQTYQITGRGCDIDLPDVGPCDIKFHTLWDNTSTSKYNKTVMCSFTGTGKSFTHYEVSGENACLSAKRLCAARPNETELYCNQLSVLDALIVDGNIHTEILDVLKVHGRLACDGVKSFKIGGSKKGTFHSAEFTPAAHDTICKGVTKMLSRVTRSTISSLMDDVRNAAHWAYYTGWQSCLELQDAHFGRHSNAQIKHMKAKLRQQYVQGVMHHDDADLMVRRLNGCIKKEWAKPGKVPRLFVSYGAGSMYANDVPENIKQCLQEPYQYPKGTLWDHGTVEIFIMSKPKADSMAIAFQELIQATKVDNHIFMCIYSDDSVYSGCINGVPFGYNVDISSCDASNNSLVFSLTGTMMANFNLARAKGLLSQCMLPVRVENPSNREEHFTVQFHSAFEGSGTVLTTILNHTASYLIACSVIQQLNDGYSIGTSIVTGAAQTGHLVTLDSWCEDSSPVYEKIQFLKYSPILSTCGVWIPTQNYGCIFRSFGSLDGDMTAKQLDVSDATFKAMSWSQRMDIFCSGVVRGLVHEPSSCILDALRGRFLTGTANIVSDSVVRAIMPTEWSEGDLVYGVLRSSYELDQDSVNRRYDLEADDLQELTAHIRNIQLGEDSITCAVTQFYKLDYGL